MDNQIPTDPLKRDEFFLACAPHVAPDEREIIEAALRNENQIYPEITDSNGETFWCPVFRVRLARMIEAGIPRDIALGIARGMIENRLGEAVEFWRSALKDAVSRERAFAPASQMA